eukprot:scaffold9875_cov199-Skeletonema_marinoi.AAC.3
MPQQCVAGCMILGSTKDYVDEVKAFQARRDKAADADGAPPGGNGEQRKIERERRIHTNTFLAGGDLVFVLANHQSSSRRSQLLCPYVLWIDVPSCTCRRKEDDVFLSEFEGTGRLGKTIQSA